MAEYARARRRSSGHRPRRPGPPSSVSPSPPPAIPTAPARALEGPPSPAGIEADVPPPDLTRAVPAPEPPPHLGPQEGPEPETFPNEDALDPPPDLDGVRERLEELERPRANLLRGLFPEAYRGETEELAELRWILANWNDPSIPAGERWDHLRRARSLCAANGGFERPARDPPPAPLNEGALLAYMGRLESRLRTPGLDFFARRRIRGFLAAARVLLGMVHQPGIPEGVKAAQLRRLREAGAQLGDEL